ncbi:326_t:CDS:1, partial [Dentiscutata heterogama]
IVGSDWVSLNVKGTEDMVLGDWICHVAEEKKYFVHYVGYSIWRPIRQNPFHDFYVDPDLGETILVHQMKGIERCNAMKDVYTKYEKVSNAQYHSEFNSQWSGHKREIVPKCWEKEQIWNQTLQCTYKNWFYEAWGFKEGKC